MSVQADIALSHGGSQPPAAPVRRLRGLTRKQAVATFVIVLLLSLVGSFVELLLDWRNIRSEVQEQVRQILEMMDGSASEAAYMLNKGLSSQVAEGLARHEAVTVAQLKDNFGEVLATYERPVAHSGLEGIAQTLFGDVTAYQRKLLRPRPDGTMAEVGQVNLHLSPQTVARSFFDRALVNAALGLLRSLAICALVVAIFYVMITRPLVRLAEVVALVDPDKPGDGLLAPLPGHDNDEFGTLVGSINTLLNASQQGLDQRDGAQAELTELTRDLERRVAERTKQLAAAHDEIQQLYGRLKEENIRLGAELDVSRRIQQMILPTDAELAQIRGLDVATYMEPATEVGGDYYDILRQDGGRLRIGIGDVTGHGLESGVVMLMTQSAVRTLVTSDESDMVRLLDVLNRTIFENIRRMGSEKNLTLALLDYHPEPADARTVTGLGGHLRIGGQHESVIVVRDGGRIELIDTIDLGLPIGLVDEVTEFVGEVTVPLHPGDTVILYTDGITEAADESHTLYGLERLCEVVAAHWRESAETIKAAVIADVKRHIGAQTLYDDLTLIVLKQG